MSTLHVTRDGSIVEIVFDRPPANAITRAVLEEWIALLPALADRAVRAVVITGTGRFFSAGLDLFEVFAQSSAEFSAFTVAFDQAFAGLFDAPVPVVAAVNGHAIAGGAVLAACCDARIMAEGQGRVGLTEIQVGLPFPISVLELVRYACAGRHLPELLGRGLTYPPAAALERNLVDEVVPAAALLDRARGLARELAALPAGAFAESKARLRAEASARLHAVAPGADPVWDAWRSPAVHAAVEAYRARTLKAKR